MIIPAIINNIDPQEIGKYPNYLLVYTHQLLTGQIGFACIATLYLYKKPYLKTVHAQHCEDIIDYLKIIVTILSTQVLRSLL